MINPQHFFNQLTAEDIEFFSGVPDLNTIHIQTLKIYESHYYSSRNRLTTRFPY